MALGIESGTVFLISSCGILRQLRVYIAKLLISFRKCHTDASFRITVLTAVILMSIPIWNSSTSSTMMVRRSDTLIFFLGWNYGMHWKSSVPRIANLTSFLQIFSSFIMLCYNFIALQFVPCCQVPHKTYSRFFKSFVSFLYFPIRLQRVKGLKLWPFFGGSVPHTDYILCRFGRTCCLQLHAD